MSLSPKQKEAVQQMVDALVEATNYTSCETWSPSMTRDCEKAAEAGRALLNDPADVGTMEYRGNSVSFIHSKMTAYGKGIDDAWQALREAGRHPDGRTSLADMIRALAAGRALLSDATPQEPPAGYDLPELPKPRAWMMEWPQHSPSFTIDKSDYVFWHAGRASYPEGLKDLFTAEQMREYAQAVLQRLQASPPQDAIWCDHCGEGTIPGLCRGKRKGDPECRAVSPQAAQGEARDGYVPLTDERITELWVEHGLDECNPEGFARTIEQAVLQRIVASTQAAQAAPVFRPCPDATACIKADACLGLCSQKEAAQGDAQPVAWLRPDTNEVVHDARRQLWLDEDGGYRIIATKYTVPLYTAPAAPTMAAPADARPANIRERWNIEWDGDALLVCFNDHEKGEGCRYERFVPASSVPAAPRKPLTETWMQGYEVGYSEAARKLPPRKQAPHGIGASEGQP